MDKLTCSVLPCSQRQADVVKVAVVLTVDGKLYSISLYLYHPSTRELVSVLFSFNCFENLDSSQNFFRFCHFAATWIGQFCSVMASVGKWVLKGTYLVNDALGNGDNASECRVYGKYDVIELDRVYSSRMPAEVFGLEQKIILANIYIILTDKYSRTNKRLPKSIETPSFNVITLGSGNDLH